MGNPAYIRMNAHEKKILSMTLKEIAEEASIIIQEAVNALSDYDKYCYSSSSDRIIRDTLRKYLPKNTLRKMGISVDVVTSSDSYSTHNVSQFCGFKISLKKGHPFYSKYMDREKMKTFSFPFTIQRQKMFYNGRQSLVFTRLKCSHKEHKGMTVVEYINDIAHNSLIVIQNPFRKAAMTLYRFVEKTSEDELKEVIEAANRLKSLPVSHCGPEGFAYTCWWKKDTLAEFMGATDRMVNCLDSAAEGGRVIPAGVTEKTLRAYEKDREAGLWT